MTRLAAHAAVESSVGVFDFCVRGQSLAIKLGVLDSGISIGVYVRNVRDELGGWGRVYPDEDHGYARGPEDLQLVEGGEHGRITFFPHYEFLPAFRRGFVLDLEPGMWGLLATTLPAVFNLLPEVRAFCAAVAPEPWEAGMVAAAFAQQRVHYQDPETAVALAFPKLCLDPPSLNAVRARTLEELQRFAGEPARVATSAT